MAEHGKIQEHKKLLLNTLERLGWTVNYDKSDLTPRPCQDFIGYKVDSRGKDGHPVIRIPATRVRQLHKDIYGEFYTRLVCLPGSWPTSVDNVCL